MGCQVCRQLGLEGPHPVVLSVDADTGLVTIYNLAAFNEPAYLLVPLAAAFAHVVQYVGDCSLAHSDAEERLHHIREALERDAVAGVQISDRCPDAGAIAYRRLHAGGELTLHMASA